MVLEGKPLNLIQSVYFYLPVKFIQLLSVVALLVKFIIKWVPYRDVSI